MALQAGTRPFGGDITNVTRRRSEDAKKQFATPRKNLMSALSQETLTPRATASTSEPSRLRTPGRTVETPASARSIERRRALSATTPDRTAAVTNVRPLSARTPKTATAHGAPLASEARATRTRTPQPQRPTGIADASTTRPRTPQRTSASVDASRGSRSSSMRSGSGSRPASPAGPSAAVAAKRAEELANANAFLERQKETQALEEQLYEKYRFKKEKEDQLAAAQKLQAEHERDSQESKEGHTVHMNGAREHEFEFCGSLAKNTRELESEDNKDASMTAGVEAKERGIEKNVLKLEEVNDAKIVLGETGKEKVRKAEAMREACRKKQGKEQETKRVLGETVVDNRKLHNVYHELKGNIRVFCRLRPQLPSEKGDPLKVMLQGDDQLTVQSALQKNVTGERSVSSTWNFAFDQVFGQESSQAAVFEEIGLLVQSALDGYRVAIFAYGQTGSGKTYTMDGLQGEECEKEHAGIIPRSVDLIFSEMNMMKQGGWTFQVHMNMIEVYNEAIFDLLAQKSGPSGAATPRDRTGSSQRGDRTPRERSVPRERSLTREREGGAGDTFTHEAFSDQYRHVRVESAAAVHHYLQRAARERHVAATACNDRSSRSHAVFQLAISGCCEAGTDGLPQEVEGLLSLVDLAGSERIEKSQATGERLKEAQHINKSLSALGDVIEALGRRGPNGSGHVPYRNSKLTMLLKESLGGESKALMFVNMSMCAEHLGETMSSLRFASKVHSCNVGIAKKTTS